MAGSYSSAEVILPHVFRLHGLEDASPSVVDVGCGDGSWLIAAQQLGAVQCLGVDLRAQRDPLMRHVYTHWKADITKLTADEVLGGRTKFDLALCLEVAEHVPEERSDALVDLLCGLSDLILWSAAVPGQGPAGPPPGLHCNEQWGSYWRAKFQSRGYACRDTLRPLIWTDTQVDPWFRANACTYSSTEPEWLSDLTLIDRRILSDLTGVEQ